MEITVNMKDGSESCWTFGAAKDINLMVAALKENLPEWSSMMITIVNKEEP